MQHNPYREQTDEEKLAAEKKKSDILKAKAEAIATAKACLDDPKFKIFRDKLCIFRNKVHKSLAEPMELNPVQDAYYLRANINTINLLNILLDSVEVAIDG